MAKFSFSALAISLAIGVSPVFAASLHSAADALKATSTNTISFSGTGKWYQFGQAPAPALPWPPFDVSQYSADINYQKPAARVQIIRKQTVEAGRNRPAPVEQKPDQYISAGYAWNLAVPPTAAPGSAPVAAAQPATLEERSAEIWSTPQGFLKAALANNASEKKLKDNVEVSFTVNGKYRYVGIINAKNEVEIVKTWIDNPVLGDTLVETRFSDYQDYTGTLFPRHIVRNQGGFPVLDLAITKVNVNSAIDISAPADVVNAKPAVTVAVNKLAEGVFYLTGGTHHSLAIEQRDHVVVIEAPQHEERSLAVIAKVKEIIPGKSIKYLINTHAHFDHSGGLRTYVDAGAAIVTHEGNKAYYQKVWAQPHSLKPDALASSKKAARFETFKSKHVLTDGSRNIEIYSIDGNSHNDAFALVYLPAEKILVEADAYTPLAPNVPAPASVNPYSVNLYDNIQKLGLDVEDIAALHGPGVVKLDDLRSFIGKAN